MNFIVIGPTGSGKTSFINALIQNSGDSSGSTSLKADTHTVIPYEVECDGRRLVFVDTPGLDNIRVDLPDDVIFSLIAKWIQDTRYGPTGKVDLGILYLQPITANRVRGSPHADIEALRKQCKGVVVRQACLVTTMWNDVQDETKVLDREGLLKDGFQANDPSALVKRFDNQRNSAWDIAQELARASNIVDDKPNEIFVLMGPTGSGKTKLIKSLGVSPDSGSDSESASLQGGTRNMTPHSVERDGRHLVFVDTPGLNSLKYPDEVIFTLIARWIETKYGSRTRVGIIYVRSITDNDMRVSPHSHIKMLHKRCESMVIRPVGLMTTMWDEVDNAAEAEVREGNLGKEFALVRRFENECPSTWETVDELIRGESI